MIRFMMNGGQTWQPAATAPANCQAIRQWGDITWTNAVFDAGLFDPVNANSHANVGHAATPILAEKNTWIVQAAWRAPLFTHGAGLETAGIYFMRGNDTDEQLSVRIRKQDASPSGSFQDGERFKLEVMVGAVSLGISRDFWTQQWHVIQVKVFFNNITGAPNTGTVEVRVLPLEGGEYPRLDGAVQEVAISATNVDTSQTGLEGVDAIRFDYDVASQRSVWDHFLVMDSDGTINNDFPSQPLILVHGGLPWDAGADQTWIPQGSGVTPPYEAVNDRSDLCTGDDGRLTSETPGDTTLFSFQTPGLTGAQPASGNGPLIGAGNQVLGVSFHHVSAMEASGNRTVRPYYRDVLDVRAEGADQILTGTLFAGYVEIFELEPVTGLAWTPQQTIDMQWGLKLQA